MLSKIRLFGFSFLILFTELALIRYIPANIKVYGYFGNLILIACFLGTGIGFLVSRKRRNLIAFFPPAITALVLVVATSKIKISTVTGGMTLFKYFSDDYLKVESSGSLILIFILVRSWAEMRNGGIVLEIIAFRK